MLWHVSEESGIEVFDPRPSGYTDFPVVWAVHDSRVQNYLLPRECPRVTFYAGPSTSTADVERFLGDSPAVVAIESGWIDRIRRARLFCYQMPESGFECVDACAGYFVNKSAVRPIRVEIVEDPLIALANRGVELRLLPSLWRLQDTVLSSTLKYSIIRMRNAAPRPCDPEVSAESRSGPGRQEPPPSC